MKTVVPYLLFGGTCREAMNYYKSCFGGEITAMQTFAEANMNVDDPFKQHIIHAEFKAEDIYLMASDGGPAFVSALGNNVTLNVNMDDEAEQDKIFSALAAGGKITMPLEKTFWGARYGQVTDRFGINWMLNCTPPR